MMTSRKLRPEQQLGHMVREARQRQGLSQASLAELVGVQHQAIVSKWEHGLIPNSKNLAALIHHLDLDAEKCHTLIWQSSTAKVDSNGGEAA